MAAAALRLALALLCAAGALALAPGSVEPLSPGCASAANALTDYFPAKLAFGADTEARRSAACVACYCCRYCAHARIGGLESAQRAVGAHACVASPPALRCAGERGAVLHR